MPLYEFRCHSCGQITELMMKLSDPAPSTCSCGAKDSLEKIISKTSFVLKGTGWYETDFKKSSSSGAKSSSPTPAAAPAAQKEKEAPASSSEAPAAASNTTDSKPHNCTGGGCH